MACNTLCWDEVIMAREIQVAELATKELKQMSDSKYIDWVMELTFSKP